MVAASEKWIEPNHKELSNKPWSRWQHHTLWTIFSWNLYVTIRSFPWRQQASFDRFWNLSTTCITELHAMLCLFVMSLINSKGGVRLIRISQNEVLFLSLITTKCSWGVISRFCALFIPSRKSLPPSFSLAKKKIYLVTPLKEEFSNTLPCYIYIFCMNIKRC